MKVEIILLLVIGLVFLIDFLMKGIKKKPSSTEVDVKKTDDQSFNNTDNKPKKKINLLKLFVVFIFGIPISLIGSYLAAVYHNMGTKFLHNFRLDTFYTPSSLINSLIFFSIYLVFIAAFWKKIKIVGNNVGVLKYISERKKNISLALIIIPFLKVILHYTLYPQEKKIFNTLRQLKISKLIKFQSGMPNYLKLKQHWTLLRLLQILNGLLQQQVFGLIQEKMVQIQTMIQIQRNGNRLYL